jgi:acyl carrier protein
MSPIFKHFIQFLSKNFFIPEAIIMPWKHFRSDLGLNSIEFLELIVYVENTYDIQIPDEELEKINTVKNLTDYLEKNLVPIPA